jgi:hypothetical protein
MAKAEADKMGYNTEKGTGPAYDNTRRLSSVKDYRIGEAADLYGDIQTAEDYGYVSRGYVHGASTNTPSREPVLTLTRSLA